jgi:uncharacterized membrane protein
MKARRVAAGQGWQWLVEGWGLFLKAPGIWIITLVIYLGISVLLSLIPMLGGVAEALLTPALTGGMIYGAAALAADQDMEIQHLFRAFQDRERMGPMLTLGALLLAGYLIVGLVAGWAVSSMLGGGMMEGTDRLNEDAMLRVFAGGGAFGLLLVLLMAVLITMAMFYAVPLVMLAGEPPLRSLQESFSACLLNVLPFLVFSLIYVVLALVAAIPLGLGFLVLGPVTFGAIYASYRDVFAKESPRQLTLS